jgi:molecular chaperone GrpE
MTEEERVEEAISSVEAKEGNGSTRESLTRQLLKQTQQELEETKDRYLRTLADLQNLKKKMSQENREAWERGALSIVEELLPILDNFERAMEALQQGDDDDLDSLREGVALIYNQLRETLERRGVKPIKALGQQFDPFWHEAASQVPTDEAEEGSVVGEIRKGYRMGDRVVRPSRVAVATRPNGAE